MSHLPPSSASSSMGRGAGNGSMCEASDLGLDLNLSPLQKQLARRTKSVSRAAASSRTASTTLPLASVDALDMPPAPLPGNDASSSAFSSESDRSDRSDTGSDTETEGEEYDYLPRVELQNMLREARRVIRQRERDLELAARVGTALVNRNLHLGESRGGHQSRSTSTSSVHHHTSNLPSHKPSHIRHHTPSHSRAMSNLGPHLQQASSHSLSPARTGLAHRPQRHVSNLSFSSSASNDLHSQDYFDQLDRTAPHSCPQNHHHHHYTPSDTSMGSDGGGIAWPTPQEEDLVAPASPHSLRTGSHVPRSQGVRLDDDELARAHAREAETQRRLASLTEENMVLLEGLTQLQSDTERNRRDGGQKLRALDQELHELRDELEAVLERNAELEQQEQLAAMQAQTTTLPTPDTSDQANQSWHHRSMLLSGLDTLPDLEGVLPLTRTPATRSTRTDPLSLVSEDDQSSVAASLGLRPSASTPPNLDLQGDKDGSSDEAFPAQPRGRSIAAELRAATRLRRKSPRGGPLCQAPSTLVDARANQEEADDLVKRLLAKIQELERTNLEMTHDGHNIDGRLGRAIEDNERLRNAYHAIDEDRTFLDLGEESKVGRPPLSSNFRARRTSERGAGNRYAIAAQRLVNDVLQSDGSMLGSDTEYSASEVDTTELHYPPVPSGNNLAGELDHDPNDHTLEVMDMLREIEELRQDSLAPIKENDFPDQLWMYEDQEEQDHIEMEDDIALVETGGSPGGGAGGLHAQATTVKDAEEADDDQPGTVRQPMESHLRSLLRSGNDGTWQDHKDVLPLGALREPDVGTTADGYDLISEATKSRPLTWADDEDYGQPITLQQATNYGLIQAPGAHGLFGSGWIIFVALRRALGLIPYNGRKRVTSSTRRESDLGRAIDGEPQKQRRLQIQSTEQLEAEAELRHLLRQRRKEFESAVANMRRTSSSVAPSSSGGRTRSSTITSTTTTASHRPVSQPQRSTSHSTRKGNSKFPSDGNRSLLSPKELLVEDLPDYRASSFLSRVSTGTEWLVDEANDRTYIKRPKPRSKVPKRTHMEPSQTPEDGQLVVPRLRRRNSFLMQVIAEPQVVVANVKTKVDDVSTEVATLVSNWVTFASILVCAGVYMFSYVLGSPSLRNLHSFLCDVGALTLLCVDEFRRGPRRVLNAEPVAEQVTTVARKSTQ